MFSTAGFQALLWMSLHQRRQIQRRDNKTQSGSVAESSIVQKETLETGNLSRRILMALPLVIVSICRRLMKLLTYVVKRPNCADIEPNLSDKCHAYSVPEPRSIDISLWCTVSIIVWGQLLGIVGDPLAVQPTWIRSIVLARDWAGYKRRVC